MSSNAPNNGNSLGNPNEGIQNPVIVQKFKTAPQSERRAYLETLSNEELTQLQLDLSKGYNSFDEYLAALDEEEKQLNARLEESRSTFNQTTAELESKGYRIVNGEVVDLIDMEPLRKWATAANAAAAQGWAKISEKVERCETAFNLRINGAMQVLQSQPGQETPYLPLLKKYLTGGSEEDVCDPAPVEDEKASENEDGENTKQG
ncbi:hypothetical protein KCU93_g5545, partial [Aureobasidium melanogenum]